LFILGYQSLLAKEIDIRYEKQSDGVVFYASNYTGTEITLVLKLEGKGFKEARRKVSFFLKKGEVNAKVFKWKKEEGSYSFSYKYNYRVGCFHKSKHTKNHIYSFPIKSSLIIISQGYNGKFSHKKKKAIDFSMPFFTEIYAARGGTVLKTVDHHTTGCGEYECADENNYVLIKHKDGTIANYSHLSPKSVKVVAGQVVETGDLIGSSGSTGFSTGPHLHFEVYEVKSYKNKTVKTLFEYKGESVILEKGTYFMTD